MSNYDILIMSMAANQAFENLMMGRPVPVFLPAGGWERVWRNIEEILELDAPMARFPVPVQDFTPEWMF